jgi:hypothetical protein
MYEKTNLNSFSMKKLQECFTDLDKLKLVVGFQALANFYYWPATSKMDITSKVVKAD